MPGSGGHKNELIIDLCVRGAHSQFGETDKYTTSYILYNKY